MKPNTLIYHTLIGMASTHLVKKSVAVRQCRFPYLDETLNGQMRSTPCIQGNEWVTQARAKEVAENNILINYQELQNVHIEFKSVKLTDHVPR